MATFWPQILWATLWIFTTVDAQFNPIFFEFTEPLYNITIRENVRGKIFARTVGPEQIAVVLPSPKDSHVKFKIVSGDEANLFRVVSEIVGNRVFLRIRLRPSLEVALNRELRDSYMLVVKARLKSDGSRNLETTTQVHLIVEDGNDLVPLFLPDSYSAIVQENIKPLTNPVLQVQASDADLGINGQVYYSLLHPEESDFTVHPVSGEIQTIRPLNYRAKSKYELKIQAEDRASRLFPSPSQYSYISTAAVSIAVHQNNKHAPVIIVKDVSSVIRGESHKQTIATVFVSDVDDSNMQSIEITAGNQLQYFTLVPKINERNKFMLQTIPGAKLSEIVEQYKLQLVAVDSGYPPLNSTVDIVIQVEDPPPHPLLFNSPLPLHFAVNETTLIGSVIGCISVGNTWVAGVNIRMVTDGDSTDIPVQIDPETGIMRLRESLDRETVDTFAFEVEATGPKVVTARTKVVVEVLEENDEDPIFSNTSNNLLVSVSLNAQPDVALTRVNATDGDEEGRVMYRLAHVTNAHNNPFVVDSKTGEIKLYRSLTSDDGPSWILWIRAADYGAPMRREVETHVIITVDDADAPDVNVTPSPSILNTNSPTFPHSTYSLSVLEDTSLAQDIVPAITAMDADPGQAGLVRYVLESKGNEQGMFTIDMYSGYIRLMRPLDDARRPSKPQYILSVRAQDGGIPPKSTTTKVTVNVVDVNNHTPVFHRHRYSVSVSEDVTIPKELIKIAATDGDRGKNAEVFYRLMSKTTQFAIDIKSGVLSVISPLDRERIDSYNLTVQAYDGGLPPLKSMVSLFVYVLDVNDNVPRCTHKQNKVQLLEDWPVGALVTCVHAHDSDIGDNAVVTYTLESNSAPLAIDSTSGCVTVKGPLDFEKDPLHNISIEVTDLGRLSSVCSLVVEVLDVDENENAPVFSQFAFKGQVKENSPVGSNVASLIAVDKDKPDQVPAYDIVAGDGMGLFAIDSKGAISTLAVFDREVQDAYWLKVTATDWGNGGIPRKAFTDVFVQIIDDNDHVPQMTQYLYEHNVLENSPENTLVIGLTAWDSDNHEESLTYKIVRGDPQSFFKIDPPDIGYITTHRRKLDREAQGQHVLEVEVRDVLSGLCSSAVVVVNIDDVNDNNPVFPRKIENINVPPNEAHSSMVVGRVFASDKDSGLNAKLTYNLSESANSEKFSINEDTGEITANGIMKPGQIFHLTVGVSDGGSPARSAKAQVILNTQASPMSRGGSNKKPEVVQARPIPISDSYAVGHNLGMLEATDKDGDHLWFDILDGNVDSVFLLRKDSGALYIAKPLDSIKDTTVQLTYAVSDGIASVSAKVQIHIDRSVAVRPTFSQEEYIVNVTETAEVGTELVTLQATLQQKQPVGLTYTLHTVEKLASKSKFKVEARTGRVMLIEKVDHEQTKHHRLVVAVRYHTLVNFAIVNIYVHDVNDHSPHFLNRDCVATVVETAIVDTVVIQVVAHDKDSGKNGVIGYTIMSGNEQGLWAMDAETGQLSVARKLGVQLPETVLVVRASDRGTPMRSDSTTVRLLVSMHSLSPPVFSRLSYNTQISESATKGTFVLSVFADSASSVRYSIKYDDAFDIHPTSGAIILSKALDYETKYFRNFTVRAISAAGLMSEAIVKVSVEDSNDHHPVFNQQIYEGIVSENTPAGTVVMLKDFGKDPLVLRAQDGDSGANSVVSYEIDDPWVRHYFSIDYGTGAVRTTKPLQYHTSNHYEFSVMALDHGHPIMQSLVPALVRIIVTDTNDHPPQFTESSPSTTLLLPTASGVIVHNLHATDEDSVGDMSFYEDDNQPSLQQLFSVDSKSGVIYVKDQNLEEGVYKYKVGVTDGVHRATTTVSISAKTPSPSGLVFSHLEYNASVYENMTSPQLTHILTVQVGGAAVGEQISYTLLNDHEWFMLNSVTGALYTTGMALDREAKDIRRLVVRATDQRTPVRVGQTIVSVHVLDTNDCAPTFVHRPYYAVVPLDSQAGHNVTRVQALDLDQGVNGMIDYSLHSEDHFVNMHLVVDSRTGIIAVATPFPEATESLDLYMTVTAKDRGGEPLSSSAEVRVKVVNRATPVFDHAFYQVHVSEAAALETVVLSISALSNVDGFIAYSITDGNPTADFDVDYLAGSLRVVRPLNRENVDLYNLTVRAVDVSRDDIHADVPVLVYVDDVNDNHPTFTNTSYLWRVSEATPVGSLIGTVSAKDKDHGENAQISYSVVKSSLSNHFEIDSKNGRVMLKRALDYEINTRVNVQVEAIDAGNPPLNGVVRIHVHVLDVNDNSPVFAQALTQVHIPEDSEGGKFVAVVSASDPDSSSDIWFSIVDGDTRPALFSIHKDSGILRTARPLQSGEVQSQLGAYLLNVSVSDGVFSAYAQVNVSLTPSAKLTDPPTFERTHFMAVVKENGRPQTVVTTVVAYGGSPPLHISFGGAANTPFKINHETGQVVTKSGLDFELEQMYKLPLVVRDFAGRQSFAELTVNVHDINDNAPQFISSKYSLVVPANATVASHIVQLVAHDLDKNDLVEYSMLDTNANDADVDIWRLLRLQGGQGLLTVKSPLDHLVGKTMSVTVRATDQGNPPLHCDVPVTINIAPPDHPLPLFTEPRFVFVVRENVAMGHSVGVVETTMSGVMPEHMHTVISVVPLAHDNQQFPFDINHKTGEITVIETLDREAHREYEVMIVCGVTGVDKQSTREGTLALVLITLQDVNDNAPRFQSSYSSLELSEDSPVGSSLAIISATDSDMGSASMVSYRFTEDQPNFKIDTSSGWLLLDSTVDREIQETHVLEVEAYDAGEPSLSSRINLTIHVQDANDQAPKFDKLVYRMSVVESAKPGDLVGTVNVVDTDLPPNNLTRVFIVDGDKYGHFVISGSGELSLRKTVDFEIERLYTLQVLASDGKHTGVCQVVISVQDTNDNDPQCELDSANIQVPEDTPSGTSIFTLIADDADSEQHATLTYSVEGSHVFSIDKRGGLIVAGELDRERASEMDVDVVASDVDGRKCVTHVHVIVGDVNDNPPTFDTDKLTLTVKENLPPGPHFLTRLKASDPDTASGGRVEFALEESETSHMFSLDEVSGALLVVVPLDRELHSTHILTVMAIDQDPLVQHTASAQVIVSVADVNDNPPAFVQDEYTVDVSESESIGFELVQVHAASVDSGENALIQYSLQTHNDLFAIDSHTGMISLLVTVDYEQLAQFTLTVKATDGGTPPLSTATRVTVNVLDENDNSPKFHKPMYHLTVVENATVGTNLAKVGAVDLDAKDKDKLTYKLSSNNSLPFTVSKHGQVKLSEKVDREVVAAYRFVVQVLDSGIPAMTDETVVQVIVADVNDNAPVLSECNLTVIMEEASSTGIPLLKVEASDMDGPNNGGPFHFAITGHGADILNVDNEGQISVGQGRVLQNKWLYLLTVSVADSGNPPLTAECPLSLHVLEKSKYPPEMSPVEANILIYMGEFPGGRVARVTAVDKDPRDIVTYALEQVDDSPFSLSPETGWMTSSAGLTEGRHVLNVSASDTRFRTYSPVIVNVVSVPKDALQYAVRVTIADLSPTQFVSQFVNKFKKTLAQMLSVRERQIQILSMQSSSEHKDIESPRLRFIRSVDKEDLEMLLAVKKGKSGYYKPQFVRRRMEGRIKEMDEQLGVEVTSLVTEVCRRDVCVKGVCREKLTLDDVQIVTVVTEDGQAFVSPTHRWTHECMCQNGYGGLRCDIPINACHRDLCPSKQLCIPMDTPVGYRCSCPPEKKGSLCSQNICMGSDCSSGETAVTFTGNSFMRYALSTDMDDRLELAIDMRTVAPHGIIMHSAGQTDYNTLEVSNGFIQYRFDCGSGEGIVRIAEVTVTDGNWHLITIVRRGRHTKLTLDSKFTAEGFSPAPNSVLNLDSNYVFFGARVVQGPAHQNDVVHGFTGCINRIYVDGFALNRGRAGIHYYNVEFGCTDSFIAGVCSSQPCNNFGTCVPHSLSEYICQCHPRFTGDNCEIDLDPCASQPCNPGSKCRNKHNDFECLCRPGYSGRTCNEQSYGDSCMSAPCGVHGRCRPLLHTHYECLCTDKWTGRLCDIPPSGAGSPIDGSQWGITLTDLILIVIAFLFLLIVACLIVCCCRKCNRNRGYHKAAIREPNNEMMMDAPISRNFLTNNKPPPPLPPRGRSRMPFNSDMANTSNIECAQMSGRPTGLVRPMSLNERQYSPSLDDHCPSNMQALHNYGSAAEELEQLGRHCKPVGANVHRGGSSNHSPDVSGLRAGAGPHVHQDWKKAVDMLSLDSIDRIKAQQKAQDELTAQRCAMADTQSLASIQCLPEDEQNPAYYWDNSDWNSTMGQATVDSRRSDLGLDEEDGAPLPQGVSAIDTDSEMVDFDELINMPAPSADFKKQIMQLQKLADKANGQQTPEDEYVTMKPLSNYQRHLDRYLPKQKAPDSTQSQRKPLLESGRDCSDDSDGGDSCGAVVQFAQSPSRVMPKLQLHTYDCPPSKAEDIPLMDDDEEDTSFAYPSVSVTDKQSTV